MLNKPFYLDHFLSTIRHNDDHHNFPFSLFNARLFSPDYIRNSTFFGYSRCDRRGEEQNEKKKRTNCNNNKRKLYSTWWECREWDQIKWEIPRSNTKREQWRVISRKPCVRREKPYSQHQTVCINGAIEIGNIWPGNQKKCRKVIIQFQVGYRNK